MKKYKVYGTYTITVTKEVWANDKAEAIEKAPDQFGGIFEFCGNGGYDKLIGVENDDESVAANGEIEWGNYIEELEDDSNYFECFNCGDKPDEIEDGVFYCSLCNIWFNANGEEMKTKDIAKALFKVGKERKNNV